MNEAKSYKVCILDEQYALLSDEPQELVHDLAQRVDAIMKEIAQKAPSMSAKKVAVLAALQLAGKLQNLEQQLRQNEQVQNRLSTLLEQETF